MAKDYIQLSRSLIQEKYLRDKDMMGLIYYLICRADENGIVDVSFKDIQLNLGFTRRHYRTLLSDLIATTETTTETTTNSTALNIGISQIKPKRATTKKTAQPTTENTVLFPEAEPTFESQYPFVDSMMIPAFKEWLEYKKERKETYKTERTAKAAYNLLVKLSNGNPQAAMAIVEQSLAHQWASMYELKTNYNGNRTNQAASQSSGRGQHRNPGLDEIAAAIYQRTNPGANH